MSCYAHFYTFLYVHNFLYNLNFLYTQAKRRRQQASSTSKAS